jgi:hypothetical protein
MLGAWFAQPAGSSFERPARGRLLSVGFDTLDFHGFRCMLEQTRVKHVLDIRLLASFRGKGFSPDAVDRMFNEFGVRYERSLELANAFVGSSSNSHSILSRYGAHVRSEGGGMFQKLISWLQAGPVLLLGRDAMHFGAEREIIVDCIAEKFLPLEVVVLQSCRHADLEASAYMIGATFARSESPKKKRRSSSGKRKGSQLDLPASPRKKT